MSYQTISVRQLDQLLESGQPMEIIDLRDRCFYQQCHIKGAVNIPYEELEQEIEQGTECLPMDKVLIFYCSRGAQSMRICYHLAPLGYRVVDVSGGIVYYRGKYLLGV
ncbi:MAG: rhodanese-like domain-containing protein [Lachnospiraceae bacterium]